ncbi:MAG: XRE family transcriptional regulator [Calditrichaeota bacterium]|nr:MAG: XRE family transcriptional regulator [Calditrichota bacterium]
MAEKRSDRHKMTEFIQEEIGAMLRATREDKGITLEQAARMMGVSVEEIVKIEKNVGLISLSHLQQYADILGKKIQLKFL